MSVILTATSKALTNYSVCPKMKVTSMQKSGTGAIRTQIQPSKRKREITKITNSQNTKRTYGQPSQQLFPKRWPLSNPNRTKNQRTNGPVNAHLISGPTVSTKTNKIGKSQPRVIIYLNVVELESPMLHAKFQDQRTSGSGEEDF